MALPTDSSETFLREVEENLRRDQAQEFAKRYGKWVVAAVVLFLGAVAGWLYWQERQRAKAAEQSIELSQTYAEVGAGKGQSAIPKLEKIAEDGTDATRATALLAAAAVALEKNDRKTALAKYRAVQEDDGLPEPYRDLALVRATALEFDTLKPEQVIARLEPLAKAGNPWFGSAGELSAMAYLKQGKKAEAGRMFAAIAADRQVPESIRSRAVQIAGTLGVDATAAMPAPQL